MADIGIPRKKAIFFIVLVQFTWLRIKFNMNESSILMLGIIFFAQKNELNPIGMFTWPIPRSKFMYCLDLLNVDCW